MDQRAGGIFVDLLVLWVDRCTGESILYLFGLWVDWCTEETIVDLPTFSGGNQDPRLQFNHGSWNLSRWRGLCWSKFLTPKRGDYFGREYHLIPCCPSKEDLIWIKVATDRFTLLICGNAAGDFIMLSIIQQPSQVLHPNLSNLPLQHHHHFWAKSCVLYLLQSNVQDERLLDICLPSPTSLFYDKFKR